MVLPRPKGLFDSLFDSGGGVKELPIEVRRALGVLYEAGLGETPETLLLDRMLPVVR